VHVFDLLSVLNQLVGAAMRGAGYTGERARRRALTMCAQVHSERFLNKSHLINDSVRNASPSLCELSDKTDLDRSVIALRASALRGFPLIYLYGKESGVRT